MTYLLCLTSPLPIAALGASPAVRGAGGAGFRALHLPEHGQQSSGYAAAADAVVRVRPGARGQRRAHRGTEEDQDR